MRVVIVGAGICGLVAGRRLADADVDVVLVDKGRSVGGRLATRRIGDATVDHGAQFFTVRTPAFQRQVDDWVERGLARVWSHGFTASDGHPRYVATAGMNALAKDLATGLDVRCSTMVFGIRPGPDTAAPWQVVIDDGTVHDADAVIVTTPLPQAFALLVDSGIELADSPVLTDYDRTIALLATLDRPAAIPPPGGVQSPTPEIGFVADNQAKGVSATPAITVHASATWSEAHWDDDVDTLRSALIGLAETWLGGAAVLEAQVKKWRFATPRTPWPDPCWIADGGTIVLAGDAFDGPRVEAAHNSGLAAAHALSG
jgi:predicted NAD/FAD-dependent oxidoreductase